MLAGTTFYHFIVKRQAGILQIPTF